MRRIDAVAALLVCSAVLVAPSSASANDTSCAGRNQRNAVAPAPAPKRDPEPGPLKGTVEDGSWQSLRWKEKSVEARTEKDVRERLPRGEERPSPGIDRGPVDPF